MLQRKILLLLGISYPCFWVLFNYTKNSVDDIKQRILVALICIFASRVIQNKKFKPRKLPNFIPYLSFTIISLHSLYLTYINNFAPEFHFQNTVILIFCSLGIYRKYDLFYFLFFISLCFIPFTVYKLYKIDIYYFLCTLLLAISFAYFIQLHILDFFKLLLANDRYLLRSVDKIRDAVIITDVHYNILYVNDLAQKLLNFNSEFLVGSKVNIPISSETRLSGKITKLSTIENKILEIRLIKAEREGIPVFFIIIKDITQDEKIRIELENKRILYEKVLHSSYDGIIGLNENGEVIYLNPTSEKLLEFSENELLGKPFHETIHHSWFDGTERDKESSPIQETLIEKELNRINNEVFWKKNDNPFFVEYTSAPILESEKIDGAVVIFRDNTEKRKKEALEKKYKEELRFISDSAMKFLQLKSIEEVYNYAVETIRVSTNARGVFFNKHLEEDIYQTSAVSGFKLVQTSIMKLLKTEMLGVNFKIEEEKFLNFEYTINKLYFLPDGLYTINYGNLNRKDCKILESIMNVTKVYIITLAEGEKLFGNFVLLYSEDQEPPTALLEIFCNQVLISIKNKNNS
jgi:PAS domain S-box-containing protein